MSLIVQALKRAQEGAGRHLPPLAAHGGRRPLPGLGRLSERGWREWRIVLTLAAAVVLVIAAGAWLVRGRLNQPAARTAPPSVLVVEPLTSPRSGVVPTAQAQPGQAPGDETSMTEVRAALQAADRPASDAGLPAPVPAAGVSDRAPATPMAAPATVAPGRTVVAPTPNPPAMPVAPTVPASWADARSAEPPLPPPVVEVHAERGKGAAAALAAGVSDHDEGDLTEAIEQYRQGIQLDPRDPALFNNLGVALKDRGRVDEAITAFQQALDIDRRYDKALNNLGVIRYQQGQYAEAIDLFQQAIRVNPSNVEGYVNLGIIYSPANRWDEALAAFQQALHYDPRSAEAYYNLGILWERRGDHDKALQHYEKFIELAGREHAALAARVKEHIQRMMERGR